MRVRLTRKKRLLAFMSICLSPINSAVPTGWIFMKSDTADLSANCRVT